VRTSARVEAYEETPDGVDALLDGGERVHAELLVGADGLRSAVRATMLGDTPPRYAGYTSWRGVAKVTGLVPKQSISETWGRGLRFGAVEIAKDETYWFAVANAPVGEREQDAQAAVATRFAHFPAPIPELVAATTRVFRTDIHDRDPIDSFCKGRVALLGDAAHPMTPDLGQGACLAIEDAVTLAKCLTESNADPLRAYDEKRVPRAREVVLASRSFGRLGRIEGAVGVFFRNLALKSTPKSVVSKQSRKVVDYSV
jgi:2-polyprenyl-6-methoxyphenol hydroxylase-like FAD-dependent oxidoreductase